MVLRFRNAALALAGVFLLALPAQAQEWRTVSSLIDADVEHKSFERYDYVNPDAPKGGTLNQIATGSFDSFNPFIVRGTPAAGLAAFGGGLLYDTLMQQSVAEPSTSYPLIADAFKYPDDYSSATYRINPKATFQDGTPITAQDVVWSFETLKQYSQMYNRYYANVTEAVAISDREVEFRFDQKGNRELPHILGDLAVLPKHWWEGTDAKGNKRDISQPTLEPPLGSGPYRIASFKPGSEIIWERVKDYWAAGEPVNIGRNNWDRERFTYFQDDNAAWQAFTKGGYEDFRPENRSQRWATGYTFPAVEAGDVIRKEFPQTAGEPMQGFVLNTRRQLFQDRRVREAFTWAFDFETMNRTLFYDSYTRTDSYFEGGELASSGLPTGKELAILEPYRDKLPPEVFDKEFKLPVYGTPQSTRENLGQAAKLLKEAGWARPPAPSFWQRVQSWFGLATLPDPNVLVNAAGQPFRVEFLGNDPTDERIMKPFVDNLRLLGIAASIRIVDSNQYINRYRTFDFDVVTAVLMQSQSPGNEQRDFFSSAAADQLDSRNLAGIKDPIVDKLVDKVIFAENREDLVAATHALDRVLLWGYYIVPHWHLSKVWMAYWNKFGIPEKQPSYIGVDVQSWWIDPEREAALAKKYGSAN
jgi:microcin C transport system substrate-binding protein